MPGLPSVAPRKRTRSGRLGLSIRITSAPSAPSQLVVWGTAKIHPKSATRPPARGRSLISDHSLQLQGFELIARHFQPLAEDDGVVLAQARGRTSDRGGRAAHPVGR